MLEYVGNDIRILHLLVARQEGGNFPFRDDVRAITPYPY